MQRIKNFLSRNRKKILKAVLLLMVVGATGAFAYNAGIQEGKTKAKATAKTTASVFSDALKNIKKPAASTPTDTKSQPASTSSSGFFRLSGTIQAVNLKKNAISIKVADGTVVALTVNDKTKYFTTSPRVSKPISELKVGAKGFVVGTISANGAFAASNIQAQ